MSTFQRWPPAARPVRRSPAGSRRPLGILQRTLFEAMVPCPLGLGLLMDEYPPIEFVPKQSLPSYSNLFRISVAVC